MTLEASEVYVRAAAQGILRRMAGNVTHPERYPEEFIENLDGSLKLTTLLVEQAVPQLKEQ